MAMILLSIALPLLSFGSTEKDYLCKKDNAEVTLYLKIKASSCRLTISETNNEGDSMELIPYEDINICTSDLAEKIMQYIDDFYNCSLTGTGYSSSSEETTTSVMDYSEQTSSIDTVLNQFRITVGTWPTKPTAYTKDASIYLYNHRCYSGTLLFKISSGNPNQEEACAEAILESSPSFAP